MGWFILVLVILMLLETSLPNGLSFIEDFFRFLDNILSAIFLFFQGIFSKIASIFDGIGDIFEGLLTKLGEVFAPMMEAIPDSPVVPFVVCGLLGLLFFLLRKPGDGLNSGNFDEYLKRTYAWSWTSFTFGMIVAGSGHPYIVLSFLFELLCIDSPMTLLNYAQWSDYAHTMLYLTIIGGALTSIIFAKIKGPRSCIRTWVGLAFCGTLGYVYMIVRLAISYYVTIYFGFLGALINVAMILLDGLFLVQFFFGIIVFILSMSAIKEINTFNRNNSGENARTQFAKTSKTVSMSDDTDAFDKDPFPSYVTDDSGSIYQVNQDGDFIYIELPGGRIGTKWEYVKGKPYFDLNGKRFYPH